MSLVTSGTVPQRAQMWNVAVSVPKAYFETRAGSATLTRSIAEGLDVHTPLCFVQNVQPHARAGISAGSGSQVSAKEMLPQWQLPRMSISGPCRRREWAEDRAAQHRASWRAPPPAAGRAIAIVPP